MRSRSLTAGIEVGPHPSPAELAAAAGRFRAVVNLRPDGAEPGWPGSAQMEAEASRHGLLYRHIPVVPGQIDEDQVRRFAAAVSEADGPVLAFCRTGTRACQLWALNAARDGDVADIMRRAAEAGYDLSALQPRLEAAARGR